MHDKDPYVAPPASDCRGDKEALRFGIVHGLKKRRHHELVAKSINVYPYSIRSAPDGKQTCPSDDESS